MTPIKALFPLLIFLAIYHSPQQREEHTKCERLTRVKVEELLGQPQKCRTETKNVVCFAAYRVQFNDTGVVEQITMFNHCSGLHWLRKDMDRIVPESLRGKLLKKTDARRDGSCSSGYEEEYACVKINFSEELCMGCAPATITIVWKDDTSFKG